MRQLQLQLLNCGKACLSGLRHSDRLFSECLIGTAIKMIWGVIPARYASTRFPGKPLALLFGKPLIQHTYDAACQAKLLDKVVVATDDERILHTVQGFGGHAVMTSSDCATGTDRIVEALDILCSSSGMSDAPQIVVNIQGDEPRVNPGHIDEMVKLLLTCSSTVMSTVATRITSQQEAEDRNVVKCVIDDQSNALYFSRALIPHSKSGLYNPATTYLRHVGLYAFRTDFLRHFPKLTHSTLEESEELEQLRVLQAGYRIKAAIVNFTYPGVDTEQQLADLKDLLMNAQHGP